ncbi:putative bifunctional diguanylate cyclase/phosphodiesterase [Saccharospirillum salsuginis]|nr:EAL domain-containing protein [Saccharospirillum salsuginis]
MNARSDQSGVNIPGGQKRPLAKKLGILVGLGFGAGLFMALGIWLFTLGLGPSGGVFGTLALFASFAMIIATIRVYASVALSIAQNDQKHLQNALIQAKDMLDTSKQLRDEHVLLQSLFQNLPFPTWLKDRFGRYLVVNDALQTQWCDGKSPKGETDADVLNPTLSEAFMAADEQALKTLKRQVLELKMDITGQEPRWYRIERHPLVGEDRNPVGVLGFAIDITAYKAVDEELRAGQWVDPVTEFSNQQGLRRFMDDDTAYEDDLWCLHIDIDHFKVLNDSMGNDAGDQLLGQLAKRVEHLSAEEDFLARTGADEFVLFWYAHPNPAEDDRPERLEDLHNQLKQPFAIGDSSYSFTVSIGAAKAPHHGHSPSELHQNAGVALFNAKKRGRNQIHWYHTDYEDQAQRRLNKAQTLKRALEQQDLEIHLQPRIDCRTGEIQALESLVRLKADQGDLIYPGHFMELAEHNGSVRELDRWVLEQTLMLIARQLNEGAHPMMIGVNLSVQSINDDTLRYLKAWYDRKPDTLQYLEIEITEHHLPEANGGFRDQLERLSSLGITLALDDFGSGYANLSRLPDLPFQVIKLDRSFIHDLPRYDKQMAVVKAVIDLCQSLSIEVVAEGVETEEELNAVAGLGCYSIQGFVYAKPRPLSEAIEWFEQRRLARQ